MCSCFQAISDNMMPKNLYITQTMVGMEINNSVEFKSFFSNLIVLQLSSVFWNNTTNVEYD